MKEFVSRSIEQAAVKSQPKIFQSFNLSCMNSCKTYKTNCTVVKQQNNNVIIILNFVIFLLIFVEVVMQHLVHALLNLKGLYPAN